MNILEISRYANILPIVPCVQVRVQTHFVPEKKFVSADENLSQPLQNISAADHLMTKQLLTDEEQHLRTDPTTHTQSTEQSFISISTY